MRQLSLEEGTLKVVINSSHGGRIQQLFYQGCPLFYISENTSSNSWVNYGGDFLWIAPQHKWGGWPPIKEFDELSWNVSSSDKKIILTSNEWQGVVLKRSIYFSEGCLLVENSLLNVSLLAVEWGLWNISQLPLTGLRVNFDVNKLNIFDYPEGVTEKALLANGSLSKDDGYTICPQKGIDFKVGGIAKNNKLVCKIGDLLLEKEIILTEKQQRTEFPHQCNIEIYKNDFYLEAELLWPMVKLAPGESYVGIQKFTVTKG